MEPPVETIERQGAPQPVEPQSASLSLKGWLRDLAISVVIAALIIIFLYQPVKVEGTSMMPWLTDQERIFINKFIYKFEDIQRGDVVVFWYPLDPSKSYIKRVVGLPGEVVRIANGKVYVNDVELQEPYLLAGYLDHQTHHPVHVGPEHYYVLGDHRSSSNDSRTWGTVSREYIYGKAVLIYWPVEKFKLLR
jgi:signal peptidase I